MARQQWLGSLGGIPWLAAATGGPVRFQCTYCSWEPTRHVCDQGDCALVAMEFVIKVMVALVAQEFAIKVMVALVGNMGKAVVEDL